MMDKEIQEPNQPLWSQRDGDLAARRYHSLGDLLADLRAIFARRKEMRPLMRGETLRPAFRERLMVVVTEVNACRYCSYYHARQALVEGLTEDELQALTEGEFEASPPAERTALLYAQHFAESGGNPDPVATARIVERYGPETANAIELTLRVIRTANLLGNTFDALLYRISFERWGRKR